MELELKNYLQLMRKKLWLIAAVVLVATGSTAVYSYYFIRPVYEASTKLIVNRADDAAGATPLDYNTLNLNLKLIDTYKEIIKTPRIMDKVASLHPEFRLNAQQLIDKIKISSVNNTQVMTLVVRDESYDRAASIANAASEVFQQEIPSIMNVDNVSILNRAEPLEHPAPVQPNPKLNMAVSLVVSLMLGIGIVLLLDYLDDTIKSEEDVMEALCLPTLAVISKMGKKDLLDRSAGASKQKAGESTYAAIGQ